jgi:predicted Zn-dependent protease
MLRWRGWVGLVLWLAVALTPSLAQTPRPASTAVAGGSKQLAPGFTHLQADDKLLLMPIDVELYSIGAGGIPEPRADWSAKALANLAQAIQERRKAARVGVVELTADESACRLAGEHCPDMRTYVLRMPYFNASMAPNGMMQVWSGLLLRMENEAQVATVLAHEIAHYLQRHSLERLRDAKARSAFATAISLFGVYGLAGQLLVLGSGFSFSRDQEREADAIGLVPMREAGFDTREAPKVWANLLAELAANPAAAENSLDGILFATHPTSEERRRVLEREAASGSGGVVGAASWQQRLAPVRHQLLDDELKRGRVDESLVLLNRLVAAEPGHVELLYYRGEARRLRGADNDVVLALVDLEAAAREPQAPVAVWRSLGYAYRQQQQIEAARAAWQRYLDQATDAPDAALVRQSLEELR